MAHHKELVKAKFQLDVYKTDKSNTGDILAKLNTDGVFYKDRLQVEKDGTKANPIHINDCNAADAETIGRYLIKLSEEWKPKMNESDVQKIGLLYDYGLYIRREKQPYENQGIFEYRYHNTFYAESKESGLKYSWNNGYINTDNAKLAARYFLNAIDRVESLQEKYQKTFNELSQNIQLVERIVIKPFEKSDELLQLKSEVAKLEREISVKIQTNQMKQHEGETHPSNEKNEAVVVELNTDENDKLIGKENNVLLKKNDIVPKKVKGLRI